MLTRVASVGQAGPNRNTHFQTVAPESSDCVRLEIGPPALNLPIRLKSKENSVYLAI